VVDTALAPDMEAAIAMAGTETAGTVVESAVETDATANATTTDMVVPALIAMHPVEVAMTAIVVARVVAEATVVIVATVATVVLTIDTVAATLDAMNAVLEMAVMAAAAKQQLHLPQAVTPMLVVVAEATTIATPSERRRAHALHCSSPASQQQQQQQQFFISFDFSACFSIRCCSSLILRHWV